MRNSKIFSHLAVIGPGIAIAATGVGAGDLVAAAVSGAKFGAVILWAAVVGAIIKLIINEGIARWQLATGATVLEGWSQYLGKGVTIFFGLYLFLWSFIVSGALISACGLAGHSLFGSLSVREWGIIHSVIAFILVFNGQYHFFERLMKWLIVPMFVLIIISAFSIPQDWAAIFKGLIFPSLPPGSALYILGVIGGVGGSVTLLSYGYWIREKQWSGPESHSLVKVDLSIAYGLTGIFGVAVMIIASGVNVDALHGTQMLVAVADQLGNAIGPWGRWIFLMGFWCAVFTSMLGVWQGIPYLFTDFIQSLRKDGKVNDFAIVKTDSLLYRAYLFYLAFPPMLLLLFDKPVWIIIIYSITGALFMPFLAFVLLFLNNQSRLVGKMKNSWLNNSVLILSIGIFGILAINELLRFVK